jgi:hypothetical protein
MDLTSGRLGLTAQAHTRSERSTANEKKNLDHPKNLVTAVNVHRACRLYSSVSDIPGRDR